MIKPIIEKAINTSSYVAIKDPGGVPGRTSTYSFIPEDGSDHYIATKESGDDGVLWGTSSYSMPYFSIRIQPDEDGTLAWIKGTTATNMRLLRSPA